MSKICLFDEIGTLNHNGLYYEVFKTAVMGEFGCQSDEASRVEMKHH